MAVLKNNTGLTTSCPSYSNTLLLELMSEKHNHDVVQLISSGEREYIHKALLKNVSTLLSDILSSSCVCDKNVLILPASPPSTLGNLVTLLYAGHITGLSRGQACHVSELAK